MVGQILKWAFALVVAAIVFYLGYNAYTFLTGFFSGVKQGVIKSALSTDDKTANAIANKSTNPPGLLDAAKLWLTTKGKFWV